MHGKVDRSRLHGSIAGGVDAFCFVHEVFVKVDAN